MAIKAKKKQKGAKGKKARLKAKLERQWGEQVAEEEPGHAKFRKGKGRLGSDYNRAVHVGATNNTNINNNFSAALHADDSSKRKAHATYKRKQLGLNWNGNEDGSNDGDSSVQTSSSASSNSSKVENFGPITASGAWSSLLTKIELSCGSDAVSGGTFDEEVTKQASKTKEGKAGRLTAAYGSGTRREGDQKPQTSEKVELLARASFVYNDPSFAHLAPDDEINRSIALAAAEGDNIGDPFASHFSKPPYANESDIRLELDTIRGKNRIVPSPHLRASLELQCAGPVLDHVAASVGTDRTDAETACLSRLDLEAQCNSRFTHIREILARKWNSFNAQAVAKDADSNTPCIKIGNNGDGGGVAFSALQASLFPALSAYGDMLFTAESRENQEALQNLVVLHLMNHVIVSRGRVHKHDRRKDSSEKAKEIKEGNEPKLQEAQSCEQGHQNLENTTSIPSNDGEDLWRDQGYTRPKVLVLLPTRGTCLQFVRKMLCLVDDAAARVVNFERFEADFGVPAQQEDDTGSARADNERVRSMLEAKGSDWHEIFGDKVNDDDDFKIGIALSSGGFSSKNNKASKEGGAAGGVGKLSIQLYSEFYKSDFVVASPLGLKMVMGENEDTDFLSSIDICFVGYSDVLLMQNWDHVRTCLECINRQPKKSNDTDFGRVRNYFLAGQAAYWKQLIVVSKINDPHILSTFKKHATSIEGRLRVRRKVPHNDAAICNVVVSVKQVFHRVQSDAIGSQGDDRINYFVRRILPQLERLNQGHTLIYVPSYFDFVALRNVLLKRESSFTCVSEYSRSSEISRGRTLFHQGLKKILLYTGRAHFFRRYRIKGAQHLIFFGLPEHSDFYPGIVNFLSENLQAGRGIKPESLAIDSSPSCLALFTKYDAHALERIVGTKNCEHMLKAEKKTYLFLG